VSYHLRFASRALQFWMLWSWPSTSGTVRNTRPCLCGVGPGTRPSSVRSSRVVTDSEGFDSYGTTCVDIVSEIGLVGWCRGPADEQLQSSWRGTSYVMPIPGKFLTSCKDPKLKPYCSDTLVFVSVGRMVYQGRISTSGSEATMCGPWLCWLCHDQDVQHIRGGTRLGLRSCAMHGKGSNNWGASAGSERPRDRRSRSRNSRGKSRGRSRARSHDRSRRDARSPPRATADRGHLNLRRRSEARDVCSRARSRSPAPRSCSPAPRSVEKAEAVVLDRRSHSQAGSRAMPPPSFQARPPLPPPPAPPPVLPPPPAPPVLPAPPSVSLPLDSSPRVGDYIRLRNLRQHPTFNGQEGKLTGSAADGRWHMSLNGRARGFHLRYVKVEHFVVLRPAPDEAGRRAPSAAAAAVVGSDSARSTEQAFVLPKSRLRALVC